MCYDGATKKREDLSLMSDRATELANRFTIANDELVNVIANATDAQLQATCPGETWPVLVTARHVAISFRVVGSWIRHVAKGEDVVATRAQIDEGNALHAQASATFTRDEVLVLLRENGAKVAETIRNLTDEQLATSAVMAPAQGNRLTADQVVKHVLIKHITDHLMGIRAAFGQA